MRDSFRVLQNIGHLLKKDAVFSLDLRVSFLKHLVLLRLCLQVVVFGWLLYLNGRLDVLQLCQMDPVVLLLPLG